MDSFKKIRRFIIFFIILYFASNFVCAKLMESKYEDKRDNIKIVSNIDGVEINFEEFSAAFSNGKVKGTVTNRTGAELVGKAIKMGLSNRILSRICNNIRFSYEKELNHEKQQSNTWVCSSTVGDHAFRTVCIGQRSALRARRKRSGNRLCAHTESDIVLVWRLLR